MVSEPRPHSAAYFGDERDLWWNRDYLELVAQRFDLAAASRVLDVGSGIGHWGILLSSVLAVDAEVTGIDREERWVADATQRAATAGLGDRFRYRRGTAEALPFEDGVFDLVTCQTVLIHVVDPAAVLAEMARVTRPGGLVLVAEPNNRASFLVETSTSVEIDLDRKLEGVRFGLMLEQGKRSLGEGDNSIGDLLPGLFAAAGLREVQVYVADKAGAVWPPYADAEQQVLRQAWITNARSGFWTTDRADARRYFVAAGGEEREFDTLWDRRLEEERVAADALERGEMHSAGGAIHYVIGGRKP